MNENEYLVKGFKASAVAAGFKNENDLDMALIFSEKEAAAAGVFTTNKVKAAPVIISHKHIQNGKARAIIANAGNANACTGRTGLDDASRTAEIVAGELGIRSNEVLVASTGVIGLPLNMDLILGAVPGLVGGLSREGIHRAARAIMTTDSFHKVSRYDSRAGGQSYRIVGISKGAGMIMPNMATMLSFAMTDIRIDSQDLKRVLLSSVETTFNRITVDGDTSTNDMVLVMANGMAGNSVLSESDLKGFENGLRHVMGELARMMVEDGEGATKLIPVKIKGARNPSDAINAARTVANSSLVKTAFYGQDPNWGRVMAALGRADIVMHEESVDIWVDDVQIVAGGLGKGAEAEKNAAKIMAEKEFTLTIDLNQGEYEDRIVTCDLTHEYITINANYRT